LSSSEIDDIIEGDKNLKNFVDQTLHELNTPIATIKANLLMLQKSNQQPKDKKRLERIEFATKNLQKLYRDIEYEIKDKIEQIDDITFDLKELIENSIFKFKDIKKDIQIEANILPKNITCDKNGFERVVDNLISNAIKYNKKDGFLKIYMNNNYLIFEDSGIGIDTKNLFIVFEKSFQENPSTKGFGIGLSIVKSYCDKYNINIKIDTQKEIGTKISLDLKYLTQN
jgi:signal transduction histidine kinase